MKKQWLFGMVALLIFAVVITACGAKKAEDDGVARPSNGGGAGAAVGLTGDATKGAEVFSANCVACHGEQGKTGIENAGSVDGSVPSLNPIDETMVSTDMKTFATNIDLFVEHGSTPEAKSGETPVVSMLAFGDNKTLQPQEIADVVAYVISLNKK
jgi:mono/diheme cytochrome c family protein